MSEKSRVEGILQATIDGDEYNDIPQSRVEELLIELKEVIEEGGGGGGTTVVPNPSGTATADLKKVKIGSSIYSIPEPTPNPSGAATEELKKLQIGSDIFSIPKDDIFAPIIYSTEEREVGAWIDDKPLYQKSYINVAGSGQSVDVTLSDLTDIETIFIVPEASASTDDVPFPYVHYNTANLIGGFFTISNGVPTLRVRRGSDMARTGTGLKYLTVRYTKTTDVPGSGSYGSLGVPMEHYDDTEKVVGTYFGKTLYEKSYTNFSSLTGQSRTLDFGLSGIDKIWYVSEGCVISDGLYPFPYIHWDPSNIVGGFWDLNDGSPRFEFRTGSQSTSAVINTFTIRYTKLTD